MIGKGSSCQWEKDTAEKLVLKLSGQQLVFWETTLPHKISLMKSEKWVCGHKITSGKDLWSLLSICLPVTDIGREHVPRRGFSSYERMETTNFTNPLGMEDMNKVGG